MIHSARPTVSPVATTIICRFVLLDLKSGDGRTICAKIMITTGRDCGSVEWIKRAFLRSRHSYKFPANTTMWKSEIVNFNERSSFNTILSFKRFANLHLKMIDYRRERNASANSSVLTSANKTWIFSANDIFKFSVFL